LQRPPDWILPAVNSLEAIWLAYLSQPSCDRVLYRTIRKRKVRQIMEIGIGDLRRGVRMIRLAQRYHPGSEVRYVGVDLFEAGTGTGTPSTSLKQAYRMLRATGARVHLIPSDAIQSLVRSANALPGNELVLVSTDHIAELLSQAWPYVPRMIAPDGLVFAVQSNGPQTTWRPFPAAELPSMAGASSRRRAA
jgi:hypothetical protein